MSKDGVARPNSTTDIGPDGKPGGDGAKRWTLRRYLIPGVLVWLPILATIWVVSFIVHIMDRTDRKSTRLNSSHRR